MKKRGFLVLLSLALLIMFGTGLIVRMVRPKIVVTATFSGYTNSGPRELGAHFTIVNSSKVSVRLLECRINNELYWVSSEMIEPNETKPFYVRFGSALPKPGQVQFTFRKPDSGVEEALEGFDSALRSVKIMIPGVNPDSSTRETYVVCEFPPP